MKGLKMNATRKALMWWFDWPGNPFVCISGTIDFTAALEYLDRINADGPAASVHHLVVAAVARVLRDTPKANARIIGKRIYPQSRVGVAMPVNLIGTEAESKTETSIAVVAGVDGMSLRELAQASRREVAAERSGKPANPLASWLMRFADAVPYPVMAGAFELVNRLSRHPFVAKQLYGAAPFTTVVSNAGAAFSKVPGTLFRAAAMEVPQRIFHTGTVWGLSALQDEVLAIDGVPTVRTVLPLVLVFDHRLIDGVTGGRLLVRLAEVLSEPAAFLGEDGELACGG